MNKKTIILASLCGVFLLLIIILSIMKSSTNEEAYKVTNAQKFFEINSAINAAKSKDNDFYSYISTEMYYKTNDLIDTYFIKGFTLEGAIEPQYKKDVMFLLKAKGLKYQIEEINANDIKEYANDYKVEETDINSELMIPSFKLNEQNKLIYYLTVFTSLLNYDSEEAYKYLSDNQKADYSDVSTFKNNANEIVKSIPIDASDYKVSKNGNKSEYTISTDSKSQIKITENGVMNFTIDY